MASCSGQIPISVIVLAHNEAANIKACLASVSGWTRDLFVVDSGSTDGTQAIAREYGACIVEHPFETHSRQWIWALDHVPYTGEWILGLDADQRVSPELRRQLERLFTTRNDIVQSMDGFYLCRRQVFRGRWIRYGDYYPKYILKLFRRGKVSVDPQDWDHHFYVRGRSAKLAGDLIEDNQKERSIAFWIEKHNRYAQLQAQEELLRRSGQAWKVAPKLIGTPDQRVLWFKQRWYRLPLYFRPALYFFYRFVLRRGFLDGKEGFIFHFLQAFWYRLLVDIHLEELLAKQAHPE